MDNKEKIVEIQKHYPKWVTLFGIGDDLVTEDELIKWNKTVIDQEQLSIEYLALAIALKKFFVQRTNLCTLFFTGTLNIISKTCAMALSRHYEEDLDLEKVYLYTNAYSKLIDAYVKQICIIVKSSIDSGNKLERMTFKSDRIYLENQ